MMKKISQLIPLLALVSCAVAPPEMVRDSAWAPSVPPTAAAPPATAGAIYQAGHELALFEDRKARNVGDVLTVLLVEKTTASAKASTNMTKESATSMTNPIIAGSPITANGIPLFGAELGGSSEFKGGGDTSQSNRLEGNITVTVAQRLPNGNLLIRGEKQIMLNRGQEFVRIQGIVRPADISPSNTISSARIADAYIVYGSKGTLATANSEGWLSKFFNTVLRPF